MLDEIKSLLQEREKKKMTQEKLSMSERDLFEMTIEGCVGEEDLIQNWRKGILG